nr:CD209 antigen-like protein E [Nothobranchius furzeri]
MEDKENTSSSYEKLVSQDLTAEDDLPVHRNQEHQVTMSALRPGFTLNHYKMFTVSLAVLALILLVVDIGLGVYYYKLTDGDVVKDISSEIAKLQISYNAAVQGRDDALKLLATERSQQQVTRWEHEHLTARIKDYGNQVERIQMDIATLKSQLPMIREGCRHCAPGWTFLSSTCFYFPFASTYSRTVWQEARQSCQRLGGDLVVLDSRDKQVALFNFINTFRNPTGILHLSGFWIGLTDAEDEGVWKWLDGTKLKEGFWSIGEPNNVNNEDCAAIYPTDNPFMAWNDAPCEFRLKWICESAPRSIG